MVPVEGQAAKTVKGKKNVNKYKKRRGKPNIDTAASPWLTALHASPLPVIMSISFLVYKLYQDFSLFFKLRLMKNRKNYGWWVGDGCG